MYGDKPGQTGAGQADVTADPLVDLACKTVIEFVCEQCEPPVPQLPDDLPKRAGCFVTLHTASTGQLRGCIGTTQPTCPTLADEVIQNAIAAASRDPRFSPVRIDELDDLEISVDVLFPPELATKGDLDPKRFGVIVSQGYLRGLLLPDLDGVDTVEDQLQIACAKAGIDPKSTYAIERFEVVRHV